MTTSAQALPAGNAFRPEKHYSCHSLAIGGLVLEGQGGDAPGCQLFSPFGGTFRPARTAKGLLKT